MRENSATQSTMADRALAHRCPFCQADPGEPCRARSTGRSKEHPHSRRVQLALPRENQRKLEERVGALCCVCGDYRTVSSNYGRRDENDTYSARGIRSGWHGTVTLKCNACEEPTRHALLRAHDSEFRDYLEDQQRYVLGAEWFGNYPPDRDRLRAEFFARFPRNPRLHHRYWVDEATRAWDEGARTTIALCGAPMPLTRRPQPSTAAQPAAEWFQPIEPNAVDWLTEFEEPETGLWWVDMDCVDCLYVSNAHRARQREHRLGSLLDWFSRHPEQLPAATAAELLALLESAYEERER